MPKNSVSIIANLIFPRASPNVSRIEMQCCKTVMTYGKEECLVLKRYIMERRYLGIFHSIYCKTGKFPLLSLIKPIEFCNFFWVNTKCQEEGTCFCGLGCLVCLWKVARSHLTLKNKV